MDKDTFRAIARAARGQAARVAGPGAPARLAAAVGGVLPSLGLEAGAVIAGFWPIGDEMDPRPLMAGLEAQGFRLALPAVVDRDGPLVFRAWTSGDEACLEDGPFGTRQPKTTAPERTPSLLLVPMLAFDRRGHRMGYGGGFYDRTLARLRAAPSPVTALGIAFAAQEVPAVPNDGHDQRLDMVATETGMVHIRTQDEGKAGR